MINISEKLADSFRTKTNPVSNPANPVTFKRRKLYKNIKDKTGGDPETEYRYAMQMINKERPRIEKYILSKNEVPLDNANDLAMQAYQLRSNEIDSVSQMIGVSDGEANIFLEDNEAETELANNPEADNFIGELFAPIGIAAKHISKQSDNLDPNLVNGILSTAGNALDKGALKRAAQNKPSGIIGAITGGAKEYNLLRSYLQDPKNAIEKDKVLRGVITDVSQLAGYGGVSGVSSGNYGLNVAGIDVIKAIEDQKKKEAIRKAMPFIIIGIVAIILVTFLIVRNANKSK